MALLKALVTEEGLTGAMVEPTRSASRSLLFASGGAAAAPAATWPPPCSAAPRYSARHFDN